MCKLKNLKQHPEKRVRRTTGGNKTLDVNQQQVWTKVNSQAEPLGLAIEAIKRDKKPIV